MDWLRGLFAVGRMGERKTGLLRQQLSLFEDGGVRLCMRLNCDVGSVTCRGKGRGSFRTVRRRHNSLAGRVPRDCNRELSLSFSGGRGM